MEDADDRITRTMKSLDVCGEGKRREKSGRERKDGKTERPEEKVNGEEVRRKDWKRVEKGRREKKTRGKKKKNWIQKFGEKKQERKMERVNRGKG